jgi:hypothetical protein
MSAAVPATAAMAAAMKSTAAAMESATAHVHGGVLDRRVIPGGHGASPKREHRSVSATTGPCLVQCDLRAVGRDARSTTALSGSGRVRD